MTDEEPPSPAWQKRAREIVAAAQDSLWGGGGAKAIAYLRERRGLSDDTIRRWRLGFNPVDHYDIPTRWGLDGSKKVWCPRGVVIPCEEAGAVWYVKIRRPLPGDELAGYIGPIGAGELGGKYMQPHGGKAALFGADTLAGRAVGVLTEGEFDAMLLHQIAGDLVGVATMGSANAPLAGRWLWALRNSRRILVAYDADQAGAVGANTLAAVSARLHVVRPLGAKDLTAMHVAGGSLRAWLSYCLST